MLNSMRRQSLIGYGRPLCETVAECPQPQGTEVLVRVQCCGVCHSDLHMHDGYFQLGDDKRLDVTAGRSLPFTLGHEIAGRVVQIGPQVDERERDRPVAVYPWIGCNTCAACKRGDENICAAPRHLGITTDGGYATHVLVPHPRYLLDYAPLSPALAATYMCSGLTAYAALKRLSDHAHRGPLLLIGLGGVGMMGLSLARAMFARPPLAADIDPSKRKAAEAFGATVFDPTDPGARKAVITATEGGAHAVCDFVGSGSSLTFATGVLAKGGKVVVTGLLGGGFTIATAMFPMKSIAIEGTLAGTLAEAREVLSLARTGSLPAIPIDQRPLADAQAALDDLRAGKVLGRIVLTA